MGRAPAFLVAVLLTAGCAGGDKGTQVAGKVEVPTTTVTASPAPPSTSPTTIAPVPGTTAPAPGTSVTSRPSSATTATTPRNPRTEPPSTATTVTPRPPNPATSPTIPTPTSSRSGGLAAVKVRLTKVATLDQPVAMAQRAGDDTFYVAEKRGRVRAVRGGAVQEGPILDLSSEVSTGAEQGLLGIAFSSDGNLFYASFTDRSGDSRLWEYSVSAGKLDISTKRALFEGGINQPYANHNGGQVSFGPDGLLYYGLGDGGSGNDPHDNAQSLGTLLGKIIRIDPRPPAPAP